MREMHLLKRHAANPILTPTAFPVPVNAVFNGGVVKWHGEYVMLARVEDLSGTSCLWVARSPDGVHFTPDPQPALLPAREEPYASVERFGVEDPRLVLIDGIGYFTYVGYSQYDPLTALGRTTDFRTFERIAIITEPENKDVVLFPERINGLFTRLDRPVTQFSRRGDIWTSSSPDLVYWGNPRPVMTPRQGKWDSLKIGAGAPPLKTPQGWLELYHGVRLTAAGQLYRLGAVLLDLESPWRVIGRANDAILAPAAPEDFLGDIGGVVFASSAILEDDGLLRVYYGASDQVVCLATARLDDIIALCRR